MRSLFVALVLASTVVGPAVADVGSRTTVEARVVLHDSQPERIRKQVPVRTTFQAGQREVNPGETFGFITSPVIDKLAADDARIHIEPLIR